MPTSIFSCNNFQQRTISIPLSSKSDKPVQLLNCHINTHSSKHTSFSISNLHLPRKIDTSQQVWRKLICSFSEEPWDCKWSFSYMHNEHFVIPATNNLHKEGSTKQTSSLVGRLKKWINWGLFQWVRLYIIHNPMLTLESRCQDNAAHSKQTCMCKKYQNKTHINALTGHFQYSLITG